MLTEQQCNLIEFALSESVEPRKVAAYLCLHIGLTLAEVAALRYEDIDMKAGTIVIRNYIGLVDPSGKTHETALKSFTKPRVLPIPAHAQSYLEKYAELYADPNYFIMSGNETMPAFYMMQNILTSINMKYKISKSLSASDLRNAFVRRCIEAGIDLYTICTYIGIKQPNVIVKRFSAFFLPKPKEILRLDQYLDGCLLESETEQSLPKRMNLLILGAGSQGPVVKEIAEAIGIFEEIAFLDDDPNSELAIGSLSDLGKLKGHFPMAIPSFGDSELRAHYLNEIDQIGLLAPSLIHPSVTLSPNAKLERAVVIEARCIVSAGAVIGKGAILSCASVIESNANIGQFVHIGASSTVAKGAFVENYTCIPSGTVVKNENSSM